MVRFAGLIVQSGVNAFQAAEKSLQEISLTQSWGKTTVSLEPVGVAGLITAWNANALFICLKLASAVVALGPILRLGPARRGLNLRLKRSSLCKLTECASRMKEAPFRCYDRNPKGLRGFVHRATVEIAVDRAAEHRS